MCEVIIPVKKEYYLGSGTATAICTLSSLDLMENISSMAPLMRRVAIVGRLLSENKGIDAIIKFALDHSNLQQILVCGKESKGHLPGQALTSLARNGTAPDGRIVGAVGPYAILNTKPQDVARFRSQVKVADHIGLVDADLIAALVP